MAKITQKDLASNLQIPLEAFKTHDAINIKGKVSAYWHVTKSHVANLELIFHADKAVVQMKAPGIKDIWVPTANVPFMTPLTEDAETLANAT